MVDLGHYKLHIDHCSVSCHVLIHSRNNLRTSLFSWMNLKASRILFRFLVFGLVAEFFPHCILSLFLQMDQKKIFGPKCTVMCYVKPPTYTVAGQFIASKDSWERTFGREINKQIIIESDQQNINGILKKSQNFGFLKISTSGISDLLTKLITTLINDLNSLKNFDQNSFWKKWLFSQKKWWNQPV